MKAKERMKMKRKERLMKVSFRRLTIFLFVLEFIFFFHLLALRRRGLIFLEAGFEIQRPCI